MAYRVLMAVIPEDQILAIQEDPTFVLRPTLVDSASHHLVYGNPGDPFCDLLRQIIDGGDLLHSEFWHPLRPPRCHRYAAVEQLWQRLNHLWRDDASDAFQESDWLSSEMTRVFRVLGHAVEQGAGVVTALERPGDKERSRHVRIPWYPPERLHGLPRRAWWQFWKKLSLYFLHGSVDAVGAPWGESPTNRKIILRALSTT